MRALALALVFLATPALGSGDPVRGEKSFRKCKSCHQVGEGASHRLGPALNGIVGGRVAGQTGYTYSEALRVLGEAGTTWTDGALDAFLFNPRGFVRGTKMTYKGISSYQERSDIIAYLATFDASGVSESTSLSPEVPCNRRGR